MKRLLLVLFLSFLFSAARAETTFFDNHDDVFIMANYVTTPVSESGMAGGAASNGGGSCVHKWNCTYWSECFSDEKQTRNCTNMGTCPDAYQPPKVKQNCTYTAQEIKERSKEPGREKATEKETKPQNETEKINEKEIAEDKIADKNRVFLYLIITIIIGVIMLGLKKKKKKHSKRPKARKKRKQKRKKNKI